MTLDPFLQAPLYIQIHAACAAYALVSGPFALYSRKRNRFHKIVGYSWLAAMVSAAISSFWIHSFGVIGPLSPLHALAVLVLFSVSLSLYFIFKRNITGHRKTLTNLYWRGVVLAGVFNFLPGRSSNRAVFGEHEQLGWIVIALGLSLVLASLVYRKGHGFVLPFQRRKNLLV